LEKTNTFDLQFVEEGIVGTSFSGRIMHFASVTSTSLLALEAAQSGVRDGVYVADEQTAGRGRGDHKWHSSQLDGLYVSALVAPPVAMDWALWLPLATALAAQTAIKETTMLEADIRWPNDLLLNNKKCGGILVESTAATADPGNSPMLRYAVIGVGINLNQQSFPADLDTIATSLRIAGGAVTSREILLVALLRSLDIEIKNLIQQYCGTKNGPGILERFAKASTWVKGKRVRVEEDGGYTGVTDGLDARGFLRVSGDDGVLRTVFSGGVRAQ
jgi:BirA family transcriptional regulator, biotin operon repressor / biotin---[acetyl-CoA-carboxylase] ligase